VRTLAAIVVALAVLFLDIPAAGASQADLERAQRRANQAAAALSAAQTRLSRIQARIADLEARKQAAEQQMASLQVSVRNIAVDQFVRGRLRQLPSDVDARDVSATTRARALASLVVSGNADAVDAYRAAVEDLTIAADELAASRKSAADALANQRARAAAVNAELRRLQTLERERIAREKARRAAAAARAPRARGVVLGSGNWICPVQGPRAFSNDFGAPRGGGRRRHQGNDILAPRGTPAVAPVAGTATQHNSSVGGKSYYLRGVDGITYFGTHLDSYSGNTGQVAAGTVLGYVGTSGNASGGPPHLHFEMHPGGGGAVNPYPTLVKYC
jgi:murein DD-endopeptidase MepM/ murein hydrolase activator NlpD